MACLECQWFICSTTSFTWQDTCKTRGGSSVRITQVVQKLLTGDQPWTRSAETWLHRRWFRISYASFSALKPLGTGWGNPEVGRKKRKSLGNRTNWVKRKRGEGKRLHDIKTHSLNRMRNRTTAWTSKRLLELYSTLKVSGGDNLSRSCYFLQTLLFVSNTIKESNALIKKTSAWTIWSSRYFHSLCVWLVGGALVPWTFFSSFSSSRLGPLRCSIGSWFIRPHYS